MKKRFLLFYLALIFPSLASALGPLNGFHDLVAGEGSGGLKDGPFYSALFNRPLGMAVNPEGTLLFVADSGNNCIRVVELDHLNRVSTLTGKTQAGYKDGPFSEAAFNHPHSLAYLPDGRIAVDDEGNSRIRLIDLEKKTVSTLAGVGSPGGQDGECLKSQVGPIWNMAYLPSLDCLFFSQPDMGSLRVIDLRKGTVSTVFHNKTEIPNPRAICAMGGKLYVADSAQETVYEGTPDETPASSGSVSLVWKPCAKGSHILAMAWSGKIFFALQADASVPLARLLPNYEPTTFISIWGEKYLDAAGYFPDPDSTVPSALVPDPASERRFYWAHPSLNIVTSFRELGLQDASGGDGINDEGIKDFEYPVKKPARTFRILLIGASQTRYVSDDPETEPKGIRDGAVNNAFADLPKRLEIYLNSLAALEEVPMRFEVLLDWSNGGDPLNLWPYYRVPVFSQKFDVDMVLYFFSPIDNNVDVFYSRPLNADQVPERYENMEYMMKPGQERIKEGVAKDFFDFCERKGLAKITEKNEIFFNYDGIEQDPEAAEALSKLYSRPIHLLVDKLKDMKTNGGKGIGFETVFMPFPGFDPVRKKRQQFWNRALKDFGAPCMDLTPEIDAYSLSYYPFCLELADFHMSAAGNDLVAFWIAHDLIRQNTIPFNLTNPNR